MGQAEAPDPYYEIKREIERELTSVHKLQGALYAGQPFAADAVQRTLDSVQEQLAALEQAVQHMVSGPEKFGLSSTTAYTRQVEVENLRYEMQDLRRACDKHLAAQPLQPRQANGQIDTPGKFRSDQTPPKGTPSPGQARDQAVVDYYQARLQHTVAAQDHELEHIAVSVGHIREAGAAIHEELEEQTRLLDGVDHDVERQQAKLTTLRMRTGELVRKVSRDRQLGLIVLLSVVLAVLVLLAFF